MTVILSSFRARQDAQERDLAVEALTITKGAICAAARLCGLDKSQMRRIVLRHNLQSMLKPAPKVTRASLSMGNAAWQALQ